MKRKSPTEPFLACALKITIHPFSGNESPNEDWALLPISWLVGPEKKTPCWSFRRSKFVRRIICVKACWHFPDNFRQPARNPMTFYCGQLLVSISRNLRIVTHSLVCNPHLCLIKHFCYKEFLRMEGTDQDKFPSVAPLNFKPFTVLILPPFCVMVNTCTWPF